MSGPWIETFTGKRFDILSPTSEMVCIEDIAHALANQCRFTGHTRFFLSVAEHSVNVSKLCEWHPLTGLLHDATEAYICDMSRPLKYHSTLGEEYRTIEHRLMEVIAKKFGLVYPFPKEVKDADNAMLYVEKRAAMGNLPWEECFDCGRHVESLPNLRVIGYNWVEAERLFLQRFHELTHSNHEAVMRAATLED